MKTFGIALMYIAICGLIGFSIYYTGRLFPLWALLSFPSVSEKEVTE